MGGGPRTFPGGVSKWKWKRMHEKRAMDKEKRLLDQEKQLYEARLRSQIRGSLVGKPDPLSDPGPETNHSPMDPDRHIKSLADRFMKDGAEDLWNEKDGPVHEQTPQPTVGSDRQSRSIPADLRKLIPKGRNLAGNDRNLSSLGCSYVSSRSYSVQSRGRFRRNDDSSDDSDFDSDNEAMQPFWEGRNGNEKPKSERNQVESIRFDECRISPFTVKALSSAGYVRMTRVQEAAISACLEGLSQDITACFEKDHAFIDTVGLGCVETHAKDMTMGIMIPSLLAVQVKQSYLVAPHDLHFQIVHHLLKEHIWQSPDYKIEDSMTKVDSSVKEAAYHAWLGYYNSHQGNWSKAEDRRITAESKVAEAVPQKHLTESMVKKCAKTKEDCSPSKLLPNGVSDKLEGKMTIVEVDGTHSRSQMENRNIRRSQARQVAAIKSSKGMADKMQVWLQMILKNRAPQQLGDALETEVADHTLTEVNSTLQGEPLSKVKRLLEGLELQRSVDSLGSNEQTLQVATRESSRGDASRDAADMVPKATGSCSRNATAKSCSSKAIQAVDLAHEASQQFEAIQEEEAADVEQPQMSETEKAAVRIHSWTSHPFSPDTWSDSDPFFDLAYRSLTEDDLFQAYFQEKLQPDRWLGTARVWLT
ncbi:hypothetical protein J5N97_001909 [Dioscorea zingiberensis]|uniref:DEAD-box RNA helicase Q domain-containing protein n=1 Tax=Dioscorea zingiberensis TaxID=325984 RepID=A0A9D5BT72_9LILI|nr:hypothetical protein J5N97_001909 [Dioscorea zingiberensis]